MVIINAIIGFIQEGKAEKALEGIRKMLSLRAHVLRDTVWTNIDAGDVVPGDIVRLRSGDRVPADMRLLEVHSLCVEESALTGESVPVEKNTAAVGRDAVPGDQSCMAFSGTLVTAGRAIGVVTHTGTATQIGRISTMLAGVQTISTPLTRQMTRFGTMLSIGIVALAILMFLTGYLVHDLGIAELFFAAIGFAVAAIPEGLPAVLSITLALGVQRMARHSAITRRLNAVETLGSVTVICSDKTGTLTCNEMTARHVITRSRAMMSKEPAMRRTDPSFATDTLLPPLKTLICLGSSRSWPYVMTHMLSRKTATGKWWESPPRERSARSRSRPLSMLKNTGAWPSFRSNPITNSWPRLSVSPQDSAASCSRALPTACLSAARNKSGPMAPVNSLIALFGSAPLMN